MVAGDGPGSAGVHGRMQFDGQGCNRRGGLRRPPVPDHLQQVQPQVQPLPGHAVPQVQVVQVQFALPQLQAACSAGISEVFMASMV